MQNQLSLRHSKSLRIRIIGYATDKDGSIIHYFDDLGVKYTLEELEFIHKYERLPAIRHYSEAMLTVTKSNQKSARLVYQVCNKDYSVETNYYIESGQLKLKKANNIGDIALLARIELADERIAVVIEDLQSGFLIYKRIIDMYGLNYRLDFFTLSGNKNIGSVYDIVVNGIYSKLVLVIDSKEDDTTFINKLHELEKTLKLLGIKVAKFAPVLIEEFLLLVSLPYRGELQCIHQSIDEKYRSGKKYYRLEYTDTSGYTYYVNTGNNTIKCNNLERLLTLELQRESLIKYSKLLVLNCLISKCCSESVCDTLVKLKCRLYKEYGSIDALYKIVESSGYSSLVKVLNKVMPHRVKVITPMKIKKQ